MRTARSFTLAAMFVVGSVLVGGLAPVAAVEREGEQAAVPGKAAERDSAEPLFETTDLALSGDGAHTYRIPALDVLPDGTLIAAYDRRNDSSGDLPGNLDLLVRRSTDNGRTWTGPQVVADYDDGVGAGDPSVIVDRETGRIFLFHAYGPKGIGFFNSGNGNGNDSTSTLHADYSYSDDGGKSWRTRRITEDIKNPSWLGMFASSGTGIQLSTGRLVQQYAFRKSDGSIWAASAYSDDHGGSWKMGEPVGPLMDENKTVELADGRVMLNSRTSSAKTRLVAYSEDGGITYSKPEPDDELIDPTNNASILRYDQAAEPGSPQEHWLLFSNTASTTTRHNMTVRMSCNDGRTWPISKVVEPGGSAYSTLSRLKDGTFGLLYESGPYNKITFARFNDAWLGADCPVGAESPKLSAHTTTPESLTAGEEGAAEVKVTNHGHAAAVPGTVSLGLPKGWTGADGPLPVPALDAGESTTVRFPVTPPAGVTTGEYEFTARLRAGATDRSTPVSLLAVAGEPALDEPVARNLDGTDDFADLTDHLPAVAPLNRGVISVRLRTDRTPAAGTLLSASDTAAPSTNVTLSLNRGVPHFEVREGGAYRARLDGTLPVADGEEHTVSVAVTEKGTALYVDGARVAGTASPAFFGHVSGLDGLWAGRNVDDGGAQWHYAGHLARVAVHGGN